MSNMSYCRFQNTLTDLCDCYEALGEINSLDDLSDEEKRAAKCLIKICVDISHDAETWIIE